MAGIAGIGPITARQFVEALPQFFAFMDEIGIPCLKEPTSTKLPVPGPGPSAPPPGKSLVGVSVVFTGVRDKDLEGQIEARGGKVSTAVSGKTSVVVAKNPNELTGKVKAAKDLGIPVVDIVTFKANYL